MECRLKNADTRGMSLIDVIIGSALVLIIFLALVGVLRTSLQVASLAKSKAMATAIAESQMEYVRSLPYTQVGTVGGIPSGSIPQNATTTENGLSFGVRTFIDYYDDPADGTGGSDTNGITTDYKRIKVAVSYATNLGTREVDIVSNYAPLSLETTNGGGTLKIVVVNAAGVGVSGASVRVVNASISPAVDVTTFSDSSGYVFFPGATPSSQYQVYVSKNGYSSAQAYARDATNQNPTPGYLTVVRNQTTTSTFAIDVLSTLKLATFSPIASSTASDTFASAGGLFSQSNTSVSGGNLTLLNNGAAGYSLAGTAVSTTTSPTYLVSWGTISATTTLPAGTSVKLHAVDSTHTPLPDSVLPGNAAGFSSFPIHLEGVSTSTYPSLGISADLATNATTTTPLISNFSLSYSAGPVPLPNVLFSITGAKTVGSTGAGAPLYKTTISSTTGSTGVFSSLLEWDAYALTLISSYDVVDSCAPPPFALSPGATHTASLILGAATANSVLVTVTDNAGVPVSGASVTVSRSGFTKTVTTGSCGTAYFGALSNATYTISAAKTGYTTVSASNVNVSGDLFYELSFN